MKRAAFAMAELVIATFVAALAFGTFVSVFRNSHQQASQTRNRAVAVILARSLLDEIEAHPYGAPQPVAWIDSVEKPVKIVVQGKPVDMTFHKLIRFLNGSFVTRSSQVDSDVVTITISWHEDMGKAQIETADGDNKSLVVKIPVWR